jgi:hypothetical protein
MGFWKREDDLERELRSRRPEPRRELVDDIARMVARRPRGTGRRLRFGVAVALTAGMLGALGAFGSLSYAANGVSHAVAVAVHAVTPSRASMPTISESSAMAQYKVALCFHGHTLNVDSHATGALEGAGASVGACRGGAFKPNEKLVIACFKGHNISLAKTTVTAKTKKAQKAKLAKLKKLGIKPGFCKA